MLKLITDKATENDIEKAAEDLDGYIKFVVDIEKKIAAIGGLRNVEGEQLLLSGGSKQSHLWGGGYDRESDGIDFDSMINIRPSDKNPSREVLDQATRDNVIAILKKLSVISQ